MNTQMMKTEIRQLLDTLNEQWEMVLQHDGRIPRIELDLMLSNTRDLYEVILDLQKKNDHPATLPSPVLPAEEPPQPVAERMPEPVNEPLPEIISETRAEAFSEPPKRETVPVPELPPPPGQASTPPPPPKTEPDLFSPANIPTSIADKLKDEKRTLNDRLQMETFSETLGTRLHQNPIRDLKSAIGINEKFQFINELFNGSMQDYADSINQLNLMTRLEDAIHLIDIYKFKYNWDSNSDAFRKIMEFVRRRYM